MTSSRRIFSCIYVFESQEKGFEVFIHVSSGEHAVWMVSYPGKQFYPHQTAVRKALLAEFPAATVENIVEHRVLP